MAQPIDEHTLLLLHGEDLKDSSPYNVPITNNGVQVSTAQSKFGGKSLYFNGNSNLSVSNDLFKKVAESDYTIDWWEYRQNNGCSFTLNCFETAQYTSQLLFKPGNDTVWSSSDGIQYDNLIHIVIPSSANNKWVHNAVTKNGNNIALYYDGKKMFSSNVSKPYANGTGNILIGRRLWPSGPAWLLGYINEFRISNVARWISDFIPPTEPYASTPDFSYQTQVPFGSTKKVFARLYPQNPDKYFQTDLTNAVVKLELKN